jgi:hypothetical protein
MLRNYLIIASLLGIGILIGYLLMADAGQEQTTVDKGGYPLVTQGSAGVMTLLRVKREGAIHDIYLPRGPLGIRMSSARVVP